MQSILKFLLQFRATFLFVFLLLISLWLIVQNNRYHNVIFFNSSNTIVGGMLNFSNSWQKYFELREVNDKLVLENKALHKKVILAQQNNAGKGQKAITNPSMAKRYTFDHAKVANKTTLYTKNYITIAKGSRDGIKKDMGVVSAQGIVGKVIEVSPHYSRVLSMLHKDFKLSAQIKRSKYNSYVQWDAKDAQYVNLMDVPLPISVKKGDQIISSGFNASFPEGFPIGTVVEVTERSEATFHDIKVRLSTDFNTLNYVYLIGNALKVEKDSLELTTPIEKTEE